MFLGTKHWKCFLLDNQAYLGRSIIEIKRDCGSMSDINPDEWEEFHDVVKRLESAFKKAFNATLFNWACLMNHAYKEDPPKPHVHWHFMPRYRDKVSFAGEVFEDNEFGHHYDHKSRIKVVSMEVLEKIAKEVKGCL